MSNPPSLILSLSEADFAPLVTEQTSASDAATHQTSSSLLAEYLSNRKAGLQRLTEQSSPQSKPNTQASTYAYSSLSTTGAQSSTSNGIPNGQKLGDSSGQSGSGYPNRGLLDKQGLAKAYPEMKDNPTSAANRQVGGTHYKDFAIQPTEFIHKNKIGFAAGNVIKYVCRYAAKDGIKDLEKAKHYIELLIEMESAKV